MSRWKPPQPRDWTLALPTGGVHVPLAGCPQKTQPHPKGLAKPNREAAHKSEMWGSRQDQRPELFKMCPEKQKHERKVGEITNALCEP